MNRRKKPSSWALYENLRQIEREEAFRLLEWAVDSLPPPWDSSWKGVGRKPYNSRALVVVTIWQGKPEGTYTAILEQNKERLRVLGLDLRLTEQPYIEPERCSQKITWTS